MRTPGPAGTLARLRGRTNLRPWPPSLGPGGWPWAGSRALRYSHGVERERLVSELLGAARKLGLGIRVEPIEVGGAGAGGLCTVSGRRFIILDTRASAAEQAATLGSILSLLDHESVYLAPEAREFIYARRGR